MAKLSWKNLVGQERVKQTLGAAFENDSLGHAYLFTGEKGVGKFQAAFELSLALLCQNETMCPCYTCESCRQVLRHAHGDFQLVLPVSIEKEHRGSGSGLNDKGWAHLDEMCRAQIRDPYGDVPMTTPPTVPVDWMREVNHGILRGATGNRRNVAILCGVELMNKESANSMLKTLEEPPDNTIIILISERVHAVLPTLVSRCQIIRFGYVPPDKIAEHLAGEFNLPVLDPRVTEAANASEGSVGRARALVEQPVHELKERAAELLTLAIRGDWTVLAEYIDTLLEEVFGFGKDSTACEKCIAYVGHLVRDGFLSRVEGSGNYITGDFSESPISGISIGPDKASRLLGICQNAINDVRARGNMHLVLVTFLMSIMEIVHVEKHPAG